MKKQVYIIYIALFICSCSDFLEEKVYDRYSEDTFFSEEASTNASIIGVYDLLVDVNYYKRSMHVVLTTSSDHFYSSVASFNVYDKDGPQPTDSWISGLWTLVFKVNTRANFMNEYLMNLEEDAIKDKDIRLAQVKFVRALNAFNAVRLWGDVPMANKLPVTDDEIYLPRIPKNDIYLQIEEDLKYCSRWLPLQSEQEPSAYGFPTKGAAQGLLAKAYLAWGKYDSAEAYCDSVINSGEYSLLPSYMDLFDVNNEGNQEEIFSIQFKRDPESSGNMSLGSDKTELFLYRFADIKGTPNTTWQYNRFRVEHAAFDKYTSGDYSNDIRSKELFVTAYPYLNSDNLNHPNTGVIQTLYPDNPASPNTFGPGFMKYKDMSQTIERNGENNMYILRYADILLMKAEACMEQGKNDPAVSAFNQVRSRSNSILIENGLSREDFREIIFEERGLEFMGELQRWFDMVRMKRENGDSYYDFIRKNLEEQNKFKNATHHAWARNYNPRMNLMPIPQSELDKNIVLSGADQNPGY